MSAYSAPDVLVIGGGAIGVSCALELRRRGADVRLVEREPKVGAGCSYGAAGLISPHHATPIANPVAMRQGIRWMFHPESPFALRARPGLVPWLLRYALASTQARATRSADVMRALTALSLSAHIEYIGQGIDTSLRQRGSLSVYESPDGFAAGQRETRAHGTSAEVFQRSRLKALAVRLGPTVAGAIHIVEDAHLDPFQFVTAVAEAALDAGAAIDTGVAVHRMVTAGGRVTRVQSSQGDIRPGEVVLAGGVWSNRLARRAGVFAPVEGGKGYHIDLPPGPGDPDLPIYLEAVKVLAVPLPDRLRLAGMFELSGLDPTVRAARLQAMRTVAERTVGGLRGRPVLETWAGMRPCTPDGLPMIGRTAAVSNLTLATGHAMKGIALAPVTGRLVAQQLNGERPEFDPTPLRPDRFHTVFRRLAASLPGRAA